MNLDDQSTESLPATHLVDRLRHWARVQPDEIAFFYTDDAVEDTQLTYGQLEQRVLAIAAQLRQLGARHQRVLLQYPPGLDFIQGFMACLYAGAVAVPAYPPRRNRKLDRLTAICADADAAVVLTVSQVADRVQQLLSDSDRLRHLACLSTDQLDTTHAARYEAPPIEPDTLALLQYTSGSTGTPKGVMVTHGNLMHNCTAITSAFEHNRTSVGLTWLPAFHDMGLVGGLLNTIFFGRPSVVMSPMAFLQKPIRWLRAISQYGVTVSGGPNFAYDLCCDKISDADCLDLDLSTWEVAYNGAEPIRAETLERFTQKFAPYGFRPETHFPCYGMAETTLILTGSKKSEPAVIRSVDANALEQHRVAPTSGKNAKVRNLVASGRVLPDMKLLVVNPDTHHRLPEGQVGEIWAAGPSVTAGYWRQPEATRRTFAARPAGSSYGCFMRTGDLGFVSDGQLFVTGRCKDVIIIRGRNLYPQDVEYTTEQAHPALCTGGCAAISVDVDNREELVVIQEVERSHTRENLQEVVDAVREAILEAHDVSPHTILLLKEARLPKTSSGKVQRARCREQFLAAELKPLWQWTRPRQQHAPLPPAQTVAVREGPLTGESIRRWLVERIAQQLQVSTGEIDVFTPLARSGLDSVALVQMSGELEDWLGYQVPPTLLFSYPTIAALADHLSSFGETSSANVPAARPALGDTAEPIAIVGMGCRLPGANNPEEFWELLRDGVDAIREIGDDRWDVDRYFSHDPESPGTSYTRHAGLLEQVDQFDPQFFGIAPREAIGMDPQQRLLLEVTWEALEHAAQSPDQLAGSHTGVFMGVSNSDYSRLQDRTTDFSHIDSHTATGTLNSVASGRIAYHLGLHGPCLTVDTACSSSLVAIHLAVQDLRAGKCRAALAGGVNLILEPSAMVALCRLRALAPDGRCKTFDASADGYGRGEGAGVVVLKRLSDARQDGDRILALIRGSAINHDGRSNGLTAPHRPSQEAVIQAALADAQVSPSEISYLEAHGTGTLLGDPIEVLGAANVYGNGRDVSRPLVIGSVKTNVGHLESAAGVAGLIKLVLGMQHECIPSHLHLHTPNPYIPWDQLPIRVPVGTEPWTPIEGRRLAGISSFGFSGTNAHLVVEGMDMLPSPTRERERPQHIVTLSARDETALNELARRYADYLNRDNVNFTDACYSANVGRSALARRLAIVTDGPEDAIKKLQQAITEGEGLRIQRGNVASQYAAKVAMLFTGQGSQYVGMGQQLFENHPTFRTSLEKCASILADFRVDLLALLYPRSGGTPRALDQTENTQPALFSLEYALYELWREWGVEPAMVLGHSIGEYVAAVAANVLSLEDALRLVTARGRLMQELPGDGAMAAIELGEKLVRKVIQGREQEVSIAAVNSPFQTVISGDARAVDAIIRQLDQRGIQAVRLTVSHGFHSPQMDSMLDEFEAVCRSVEFSAPTMPVASNVYGRLVSNEVCSPEYWRRQIREPVRFADAMADIDRNGADVYLEVGAKPVLIASGRHCVPDTGQLWVNSLHPKRHDFDEMLHGLAALFVRGVDVDWHGFDKPYARHKIALPTYPFQRQRYWVEETRAAETTVAAASSRKSERASAADMRHAFYEIQWQPRSRWDQPLPRRAPGLLPPTQIAAAARPQVERLQHQLALPRYTRLDAGLDQLSAAFVHRALTQLGWQPDPGETFDQIQLAHRLGVHPKHRRLWRRMLEILAEESVLVRGDEAHWCVNDTNRWFDDPFKLVDELSAQFPECNAELTLLRQCGSALAGVLTGRTDPLEVLFPSGSSEMVERLYRDSPFARTLNAVIEESIIKSIEHVTADRPIKILEIGAGTGGTTAQLLHRLPAERTEYLFTDVSELFTRAAAQRFAEFPFVRYGLLDIEVDPSKQGYADHQFDLILAANVLHATQDLGETVQHIQQLLVPGGTLVVAETTRRQRWLDLIFGLTEGWWRFSDVELRPDHPLLSPQQWIHLFEKLEFASAAALPSSIEVAGAAGVPPHAVLVAQTAAIPSRNEQPSQLPAAQKAESWLLLSDRQGVGDRLADDLEHAGHHCLRVYAGACFAQLGENRFEVNPAQLGDLGQLFNVADVTSDAGGLSGVLHLWSLDAVAHPNMDAASLQRSQQLGAVSVPSLLRAISQALQAQSRTWFVTRGAQPIPGDTEMSGLAQSPLIGLARVVSQELPALWGGLIDLDPKCGSEISARQIAAEVLRPDTEDQVAYRHGQRFAARLEPLAFRPAPGSPRCHADGSYLITGGLGDLGLRVAEWLAARGARNLVLTGRSSVAWTTDPASGDPRGPVMERLRASGVAVRAVTVDVADEPEMQSLFANLTSDGWPPIRGIVHCAGVADALPLLELSDELILAAFRAKVTGTWVLHRLTASVPLDFFVSFSSGATLLGSPLLGSYAAANTFLDAVAHLRRSLGENALTVNWGFWDDVGMVSRTQKEMGHGFAPRGMQSFSPEQALQALEQLMLGDVTQSAVMPVNWPQWCEFHPTAGKSPLLSNVLRGQNETGHDADASPRAGADRERILAAGAADRLALLEQHLSAQLGRVLRIPAEDLDMEQPLNNLGIDSLMAVEFRNHVQLQLQASIPVTLLLQGPTIRQVAKTLLDQLNDDTQTPPLTPELSPDPSLVPKPVTPDVPESETWSATDLLSRLDELSDSQVDLMLDQMLDKREGQS